MFLTVLTINSHTCDAKRNAPVTPPSYDGLRFNKKNPGRGAIMTAIEITHAAEQKIFFGFEAIVRTIKAWHQRAKARRQLAQFPKAILGTLASPP